MVEVTQELKPCPFCGGAAKAVTCRFDMWIVECGEKHSNGLFYREKAEAIAAWNTRHQPQPSAEQDVGKIVAWLRDQGEQKAEAGAGLSSSVLVRAAQAIQRGDWK